MRTRMSLPHLFSIRPAIAALALVVSPALAAAQGASQGTVTGRITDAQTQRPLGGAFVVIAGTQQGVSARDDGTYRILLRPGTHELRARIIGYGASVVTVNVTAGGTTTQDFALNRAVVNLSEVAVVGTRAAERTVTNAPVPIDILGQAELQSTGATEVNQVIQMLAPSFNFPRPSIADGTDHVRPSTLRGLGPDQVLVLLNGKRRHNSALVNVNGTVGRGATGVDLNAIPLSSIDHIEILRDGAAAQYGSDAIAGVINIVLKSEPRADATFQTGQTYRGDGDYYQVGGSKGIGSASGSFVNVAGEFHHRGYTNRADVDTVSPFFPNDLRNNDPQFRARSDVDVAEAAHPDGARYVEVGRVLREEQRSRIEIGGGGRTQRRVVAVPHVEPETVAAVYRAQVVVPVVEDALCSTGDRNIEDPAVDVRQEAVGIFGADRSVVVRATEIRRRVALAQRAAAERVKLNAIPECRARVVEGATLVDERVAMPPA